jgi:DNA sulfur modification protein DndD
MLLRKIFLENYGLYSGKIEFDLVPRIKYRKERPIILLGGKNGSGKTTLLDAIRLVLYGRAVLGNRVTQREYESFLRKKIYRGKASILPQTHARVAIEFDHAVIGERSTYFVERSWTLKGKDGVNEFLKILNNGKIIEDVTPDFWRGFIEEIIPERLSQFFFFDGEKIKNIAEDKSGNRVLADSIKTLLGLDIVERLKADLSIYTAREAKKTTGWEGKKAWEKAEEKIAIVKQEISLKLDELANVRTTIDGILADIRKRENRLHREGHVFAIKHDKLKSEKSRLGDRITELEGQIRTECEKTFPFSLCPSIVKLLRTQMQKENELRRWMVVQDELKDLLDEILTNIASTATKLGKRPVEKITHLVRTTITSRTNNNSQLKGVREIHCFSEYDSRKILSWANNAEKRSLHRVRKAVSELDSSIAKLRKITRELTKIPDEDQVKPLFEELSFLNQRLGEFQHKSKQLQDQIKKREFNLKSLQRDLKRHIDRQMDRGLMERRLSLVKNIQAALDTYLTKLTDKKISQLRLTVAEGFNILSRKVDIIKNIDINPETFAVTLYDQAGKAIPKEDLSSGEKQLYAVAMLWGLAKTSGLPLPVIIDTPLGRLDSDHRHNLINNYFPHASHQVILLSTDTEVDQKLFRELNPNISHCYHLIYGQESGNTKVKEEYFWKESRTCLN